MTNEELFEKYPELVFYDFEVFPRYWCMVMIDKDGEKEIEDPLSLSTEYGRHRKNIWVGYNSNHYDRQIFANIYFSGERTQDEALSKLYKLSQRLILGTKLQSDKPIPDFISYDTGSRIRSLKQCEAFMGSSIWESDVPFDKPDDLTDEEKSSVKRYCRHDVEQTIEVFKRTIFDFEAQKSVIETFGLDDRCYSMTKAQLTATVLGCTRLHAKTYDAEGKIYGTEDNDFSGEEWKVDIFDTVHIGKYKEVLEFFSNPENYKDNDKLKIDISGVPHVFGLGGIHGALKKYHKKGHLLHVDVTSYYPSIMIQYNRLTRRAKDPELFKQIYDTRVQLKKEGKKQEQAPYKIILNSTFGITNQETSNAYDPQRNHSICINGQLMLLMLLEKLEGHCQLVQSNTDGIIISYDGYDLDEIKTLCNKWCKETKMTLGYDYIDELWQKDVNNYLFRYADSRKYEAKGAYVKFNSDLDNDQAIVNEAVRQGLIHNSIDAVDKTIEECMDLAKFQKVVKLSDRYKYAYIGINQIQNHKCFRVFAVVSGGDKITKQKEKGATMEKFGNTPDNAMLVFDDLSHDPKDYMGFPFSIDRIDKDYYKEIARDRFLDFSGGFDG